MNFSIAKYSNFFENLTKDISPLKVYKEHKESEDALMNFGSSRKMNKDFFTFNNVN